jgi:hypothetical protein
VNTGAKARGDVLAVLDDAAAGAAVLEWSIALARVAHRDLAIVFVESMPALRAAALPFTRVLQHAGAQWAPFDTQDVERGYRVQAARLRALAEQASLHHQVRWTMRTTRGALAQAALSLQAESDLVLIGSSPIAVQGALQRLGRARRVMALVDNSQAGERAQRLAGELGRLLGASLVVLPGDAASAASELAHAQADLLVLPRGLAGPAVLALARRPFLLVG